MAAKKEIYKSKAAKAKHEKAEGKKEHKAEKKAGVKDIVKPIAKKKIVKSI